MDEFISHMQTHIEELRELLQNFDNEQDQDTADVGNEDRLRGAHAALDTLEGHVNDLVP